MTTSQFEMKHTNNYKVQILMFESKFKILEPYIGKMSEWTEQYKVECLPTKYLK